MHAHRTHAGGLRECARTPVCRAARRTFQRPGHDGLDLRVTDRPRRAGPRFVQQPLNALVDEPLTPAADGRLRHAELLGHRRVVESRRTRQNNACSARKLRGRARPMRHRVERLSLLLRHHQRCLGSSHDLPPVALYDERQLVIYIISGTGHQQPMVQVIDFHHGLLGWALQAGFEPAFADAAAGRPATLRLTGGKSGVGAPVCPNLLRRKDKKMATDRGAQRHAWLVAVLAS